MKTYRQFLIPNNGLAGTEPPVAELLNQVAAKGYTFETFIPVPGTFLCALVSKPATDTGPNPFPPSPKKPRSK
jgi:hypothetical protein